MPASRWQHLIIVGAVAVALNTGAASPGQGAEPGTGAPAGRTADAAQEMARLKEEIERLKALLPDQAHVMKDVGYHFANLWFAGQAKNWPLAKFYLDETRSHLKWAVRVRPTRRTEAGEIDLRAILDGLDRSVLASLHRTIDAQDAAAFSQGYRESLVGCYACHQASEKPYLRLRLPEAPEGRMIDLAPGGTAR